jgi:hypothetical protein
LRCRRSGDQEYVEIGEKGTVHRRETAEEGAEAEGNEVARADKDVGVHNGMKFINVFVTEDMVGHKLGEFALTRIFRAHSQAGSAAAKTKTE